MKTAIEFLADQISGNSETRKNIKRLQEEAAKTYKHKDERIVFKLKDLLQMIPQHIMRYPMMLGSIQKHADRSKRKDPENETKNANEVMKNIVAHIDRYSNDHNYIETLRVIQDEVKDVPVQNLHDFGILKHELKNIEMKNVSAYSFGRFQLLMFENYELRINAGRHCKRL